MAQEADNKEVAVASDGSAALPALSETATQAETNDDALGENRPLLGVETIRQLVLAVAIVISLLLIVMIFLWAKAPTLRPLASYDTDELIEVLDYLDKEKATYVLEGNTVLVPDDEYAQIKLNLTRIGLNRAQEQGDEILMQDMGFGVSQELERERLKLSRERQLASAIEKIYAVNKASVLLATPKQSVFVRHNQEATATVFLTVRGNTQLGQEEVDSIVDMVASAVPNLQASKVTVTDQYGRLLSSGSQDPVASQRRKEYELERKQEESLREKIDAILMPVLGIGNYTSQVDVSLDFSSLEETSKQFTPGEPAAIRSEYTSEQINTSDMVAGVPGALSNQPPANAAIPEAVSAMENGVDGYGSTSREATRNYEIDTMVRHRRGQTGEIARQTVSVAVDYVSTTNPETGEVTRTPVAQEELEKIRRLLIGGVGFSEQRGDILEVIAVPFVEHEFAENIDVPIWQQPQFSEWVRWLSAALVIITLLVIFVRPAMKKLINPKEMLRQDTAALGYNGEETGLLGDAADDGQLSMTTANLTLPDLHKDEDLLKAVRALVANEPTLATQVIKGWIKQDD